MNGSFLVLRRLTLIASKSNVVNSVVQTYGSIAVANALRSFLGGTAAVLREEAVSRRGRSSRFGS
jgi:hypothetical protein